MTNSEAPTEAFGAALRYYDRKILAGFQHIWAENEDDFRSYPYDDIISRLNLSVRSYAASPLARKLTWAIVAAANPDVSEYRFRTSLASSANGDWRTARHCNEMADAMQDWGYRLVKRMPYAMGKPAFRNGTITEQMPLLQAAREAFAKSRTGQREVAAVFSAARLAADAKKLPRHMRPSRIQPQPAISFGGGVTHVI